MMTAISEDRMSDVFENLLRRSTHEDIFPKFVKWQRELACLQGRPDFVAPSAGDESLRGDERASLAEALSTPSQALTLSLIKRRAPRTEQYLLQATGLSRRVVRRAVATLLSCDVISCDSSSRFTLSPRYADLTWDSWAFELKVSNWQRALFQACQYQAFAQRAVVIIAERWAHRAEQHLDRFRALR